MSFKALLPQSRLLLLFAACPQEGKRLAGLWLCRQHLAPLLKGFTEVPECSVRSHEG